MKEKEIINIGLIGFGVVGTGVVKILRHNEETLYRQTGKRFILRKIVDKDISRPRDVEVPQETLSTDIEGVVTDHEIDLIIELIGGYEPARTCIITALRHGKDVVTANKAVLSRYWKEIFSTASEYGVNVGFEGSVCGGIPIISSITEGLVVNRISTILGIINGTCNYILTQMTITERDFGQILKEAQEAGYAETDPTLDIEGNDTAHKLAILSSIILGQHVSDTEIYTEGITKITRKDILYAHELGYTIKLLGIMRRWGNECEIRVHPTMLPNTHPLSSVNGVYNAIYLVGDLTGPIIFYGQGAGQMPTASAVVSDIVTLSQKKRIYPYNGQTSISTEKAQTEMQIVPQHSMLASENSYYIRFTVADQPGVLATITKILGNYKISILSVIQKERGEVVSVIMLTHKAEEDKLYQALDKIDQLPVVKDKSLAIRVIEEIE